MTWLDVALLYMTVLHAVLTTAQVWGPLLGAALVLLLVVWGCAAARRRAGHRLDMTGPLSGGAADSPDKGAP